MSESKRPSGDEYNETSKFEPIYYLFCIKLECLYHLNQYQKSGSASRDEKKQFFDRLIVDLTNADNYSTIIELINEAVGFAKSKGWNKGVASKVLNECQQIMNGVEVEELNSQIQRLPGISPDNLYSDKLQCSLPLMGYIITHIESNSRNHQTIESKILALEILIHDIFKARTFESVRESITMFMSTNPNFEAKGNWTLFQGKGEFKKGVEEALHTVDHIMEHKDKRYGGRFEGPGK